MSVQRCTTLPSALHLILDRAFALSVFSHHIEHTARSYLAAGPQMSNSRSSEDDALFEDLEACKRSLDTRIYINGKADWPTELGRSLISSLMQIPAVQLKAYRVEVDSMIAFMLSGRSLDEPYTFQSRTTERTYRDRVRKVISSAEEEVRKHEDWSWKWLK